MDNIQLLYKYMSHLQCLEDSTFLELMNTPFSPITFAEDELALLRAMELSILSGEPIFMAETAKKSIK